MKQTNDKIVVGKEAVKDVTFEIVVDMRKIERHFFGWFGWRKWLAIKLIALGSGLVRAKYKVRS